MTTYNGAQTIFGNSTEFPLKNGDNNDAGAQNNSFGTSGGVANVVFYTMRAFDTNGSVNRIVYWRATAPDSAGAQYTDSVGPLTDIVLIRTN